MLGLAADAGGKTLAQTAKRALRRKRMGNTMVAGNVGHPLNLPNGGRLSEVHDPGDEPNGGFGRMSWLGGGVKMVLVSPP